jgi:hypothetical protein
MIVFKFFVSMIVFKFFVRKEYVYINISEHIYIYIYAYINTSTTNEALVSVYKKKDCQHFVLITTTFDNATKLVALFLNYKVSKSCLFRSISHQP